MAGAATASVPARAGTILGMTRSTRTHLSASRTIRTLAAARRSGDPGAVSPDARSERLDLGARRAREARSPTRSRISTSSPRCRLPSLAFIMRRPTATRRRPSSTRSCAACLPPRSPKAAPASVDAAGKVLAVHPPAMPVPATLIDLLGEAQPLSTFADRAGVMTIKLASGVDGIATVRSLPASSGQIALVQPLPRVLSGWWSAPSVMSRCSAPPSWCCLASASRM